MKTIYEGKLILIHYIEDQIRDISS